MKYEGSNAPPAAGETTIALSRRDIEEAKRLLRLLSGEPVAGEPPDPLESGPSGRAPEAGPSDRAVLGALARKVFIARHARHRFFGKAMFGEPAWDMLLTLYITETAGPRQTVGKISEMSGAPASSAARWLQYLEKERLIIREPHATDRRVIYVELTTKGRETVEGYLASLSQLIFD